MTGKTNDTPKADAPKKTLSDGDIATFARRNGPSGHRSDTDVDAHSDIDAAPKSAAGIEKDT